MSRGLWVPLGVAVALHTVLAAAVAPRFEVDSALYQSSAESLVAVGAALDPNGQPENRITPGYSAFLALFLAGGLGYTGAVAAQHVLWIALSAGAMWLVLRLSGSVPAASVAGLITALDLPAVQSSITILSETLAAATIFAAVCGAWFSIRAAGASTGLGWAMLAGLMAGATALVRPIAMLLGVPLAIAIAIGADPRWRLRAAAGLLAAFAILPALWMVRNARQTGVATLSSLAGLNLLQYRAAGTLAIGDPGGIDANLIRRREELELQACGNLETIYQRPCATLSFTEKSGEYARVAWPVILGHPIATARQSARALGMIVFGGGANLLAEVTGLSEPTTRLIALAYTLPMAILAVLGIPYWWRRHRAFALLVLLVVGYMFGMALGAEAYSRFRVPVITLYAMLCGGGAARLLDPKERLTS
jgi:hypothetical protein